MGSSFYNRELKIMATSRSSGRLIEMQSVWRRRVIRETTSGFFFLKERVSVQCFRYFCIEGSKWIQGD